MRVVTGLLAAVGGLSVPSAALMHGVAHWQEAQAYTAGLHDTAQTAAVHAEAEPVASELAHHPSVPHDLGNLDRETVVTAPHDAGDHGHPQFGRAMSSSVRVHVPALAAPMPTVAMPAVEVALVASAALRLTAAPPRAGPAQVPPPPSRAPPIV